MMRRHRSALIALSIALAALAMGLWLHNFEVSPEELARLHARLRWWPVLPLFGLLAAHVALSSWRWSLIEVGLGGPPPRFRDAFAAGAFALGLGTFLPSPIVNVACRGLGNRINGASGLRGALSGGIDQIADLAVVVLLVGPSVIGFVHRDLTLYLVGVAAMVVVGLAILAALPVAVRVLSRRVVLAERIMGLANHGLLLRIYGLSLLRVANLTAMTLAIHAMTGAATVPAIVIGVPLVTLAISAAMLPGAFGVSEWSFSAVFAGFGVAKGEIVVFVLGNRIVLTGLSLALALVMLVALLPALLRRGGGMPQA